MERSQDIPKVFLFLQGPPSIFARTVGDELELLGHKALRINLCSGDWLDWNDRRSVSYRGRLENWKAYLKRYMLKHGVTDLVYYADRQPYHVAAVEVAKELGVVCTTYENGYLRPDWLTLERLGMSAHSLFPEDPDVIRKEAKGLPEIDRRKLYGYPFINEAYNEVLYNMANVVARVFYPFYRRDKFYHPFPEYISNIPRLLLAGRRDKIAGHLIDDLIASGCPYYVFPLQLQSDYQLRYNSPFNHIGEAVEMVLRSFSRSAPVSARLVFKIHPLDNGLEPWKRIIRQTAKKYGVKKRSYFIDGGNLDKLLVNAQGALTINSTTGIHALRAGCRTKILGIAAYDMPGLTSQSDIDGFWTETEPPDAELLDALERLLAASIQLKGCFYTDKGRRAAAYVMARRLAEDRVNLPGALCKEPPRLQKARDLGIATTFDEQMADPTKTERWRHAWVD